MDKFGAYVIGGFISAVIGAWTGAFIVSNSWQRDCLGIGGHVVGDVVYQCSKKEK